MMSEAMHSGGAVQLGKACSGARENLKTGMMYDRNIGHRREMKSGSSSVCG